MGVNSVFWRGKRVLVTGHTGFKGSWLCLWLLEMGAEVIGYALSPASERDNYATCRLEEKVTDIRGNILDAGKLEAVVQKHQPEIVFHLAAQPLVRRSYQEPKLTYETNVIGTLNVLEAIRHTDSVHSAVMITTDKCYENRKTMQGYRETDPMGGYDPYSASKGCAEILIASYRRSFFTQGGSGLCQTAVASARAGNVIGGGDWAADRLIPDCIRAMEAGKPVVLRNPGAVRPWQFVLEPLRGYLMLAERLWEQPAEFCEGWNFGPDAKQVATVGEVAGQIAGLYGGSVEAREETAAPHEDAVLLLDSTKARERLGWVSQLPLEETLRWTAEWYREYRTADPEEICRRQIHTFYQVQDKEQV